MVRSVVAPFRGKKGLSPESNEVQYSSGGISGIFNQANVIVRSAHIQRDVMFSEPFPRFREDVIRLFLCDCPCMILPDRPSEFRDTARAIWPREETMQEPTNPAGAVQWTAARINIRGVGTQLLIADPHRLLIGMVRKIVKQ